MCNREYTLKRSNRKTVALYVRDGALEVRAPMRMPKADIDLFIASKEKWIADKLGKSIEQMARRESFTLNYGDKVILRGKEYPIAAKDGGRIGFDEECFYMPPGLTPEQIKHACVRIYRLTAKRRLTERTLFFAGRMSAQPSAIRISGAKTRWGSCSAKKSINYSWRLIMADDDVIDYVVVHELAHLTEMNHSKRFWAIVEGILPDCKRQRARLKDLQSRIGGENWE